MTVLPDVDRVSSSGQGTKKDRGKPEPAARDTACPLWPARPVLMNPDQEPAEQAARRELCVQDSDTEAWVGAVTCPETHSETQVEAEGPQSSESSPGRSASGLGLSLCHLRPGLPPRGGAPGSLGPQPRPWTLAGQRLLQGFRWKLPQ